MAEITDYSRARRGDLKLIPPALLTPPVDLHPQAGPVRTAAIPPRARCGGRSSRTCRC